MKRRKPYNDGGTLCWKCGNYSCSWIKKLEPIPGWSAKPTKVRSVGHRPGVNEIDSYTVRKCPEYVKWEDRERPTGEFLAGNVLELMAGEGIYPHVGMSAENEFLESIKED